MQYIHEQHILLGRHIFREKEQTKEYTYCMIFRDVLHDEHDIHLFLYINVLTCWYWSRKISDELDQYYRGSCDDCFPDLTDMILAM